MDALVPTLRHNEPLVREILDVYWATYRIKPDAAEVETSMDWGMGLDKETLEYALDVDNHGDFSQNRNPRLFDLKRLANNYREARGDFYRAPLPDTSLPKEPECLYCAGPDVFDIVFEGNKWSVKKIGTCAVCSGGEARTNAVFIEIAERYNINVGEVMYHFTLSLLKYKFGNGLTEIPNSDVKRALETFKQEYDAKIATQRPERPATPVKPETDTQVPLQPETPLDYDFGDGWEAEQEGIPF